MNKLQRQVVLLTGFMVLLAAVVLFTSVYGPEPLRPPPASSYLPESVNQGINQSVYGWKILLRDLGSFGSFSTPS